MALHMPYGMMKYAPCQLPKHTAAEVQKGCGDVPLLGRSGPRRFIKTVSVRPAVMSVSKILETSLLTPSRLREHVLERICLKVVCSHWPLVKFRSIQYTQLELYDTANIQFQSSRRSVAQGFGILTFHLSNVPAHQSALVAS